jgi:hypothetical protein
VSAVSETRTASVSRPGTRTAAVGLAVVTALAAIVDASIILSGGLDLVKEVGNEIIAAEFGVSRVEIAEMLDFAGPVVDEVYAEALRTFETRAYLVLVFGAALLASALLMRGAATTFRVLVTVTAAPTTVFAAVIATNVGTTAMTGLGWTAVLGGLVTIVTTWLPANGKYARAVR